MSSRLLVVAAILAFAVAFAHSWLGERYILMRLFRREDLPRLFGNDWFTKRTLRFTWHLTSVAVCGFALLMLGYAAAGGGADSGPSLRVISVTFGVSAVVAFAFTRGRHLSWIALGAISVLCWLSV